MNRYDREPEWDDVLGQMIRASLRAGVQHAHPGPEIWQGIEQRVDALERRPLERLRRTLSRAGQAFAGCFVSADRIWSPQLWATAHARGIARYQATANGLVAIRPFGSDLVMV